MKYIIGISAFYYESSVALLEDGVVKEFLKEESFTRIKGTNTFPKLSLSFLKKKYSLSSKNIGACVFYEKPLLSWSRMTYYSMQKPLLRWKINSQQFKNIWKNGLLFDNHIKNIFNLNSSQILFANHHVSHALTSTIYENYFRNDLNKDKLIIVVDGVGDGETLSIYTMTNDHLNRIYVDHYPHSLGLFYSTVTDYLGYNVNEGEFKVMGLSGYGRPVYKSFILENIINWNNNKIQLNMEWFDFDKNPEKSYSEKFSKYFGQKDELYNLNEIHTNSFQRAANIACSFQESLEFILSEVTKWAVDKTGISNVYFSGGVSHNSKAMAKIANLNKVKKFTVPPSPGDSGAALGAASFGNFVLNNKFISNAPLYFTNNFFNPQTNIFSDLFEEFSKITTNTLTISSLIIKGEIICIFDGGSEAGPRALGNRSIICSAKLSKTVQKLNSKVKGRESFRPLSPVILDKNLDKFFYVKSKFKHNLEWMGLTLKSKKNTSKEYSSCIHIDGTARVQILINKELFLYKLLEKLEKNDHQILINTSFNSSGEPIVFDYMDCYISMKKMNLKYLYFDGKLYLRK